MFTTCRKFKGLEADAVVIIDLDETMMDQQMEKLIYVGTSRARYGLSLVASLTEEQCVQMLKDRNMRPGKKPRKSLATAYNAKLSELKAHSLSF